MTDTEINDLVAELKMSDTFPQFETPNKVLIDNRDAVMTPEAISVTSKLLAMTADLPTIDAANITAKILSAVDPKQAGSLWVTLLSDGVGNRDLVKSWQISKQLTIALRWVYGMGNSMAYDMAKMTDDDYRQHIESRMEIEQRYSAIFDKLSEEDSSYEAQFSKTKAARRAELEINSADLIAKFPV